jgi:acylphosphatase
LSAETGAAELRLRVVVHGRVQGVGYRAFVAQQAFERGISGFVRNRRDGTVEALLIGGAPAVTAMLAACEQGPLSARVTRIEQQDATPALWELIRPGELFSLLPTT